MGTAGAIGGGVALGLSAYELTSNFIGTQNGCVDWGVEIATGLAYPFWEWYNNEFRSLDSLALNAVFQLIPFYAGMRLCGASRKMMEGTM